MSIPLPHPEIFDAVAPGDDLLIDDGRVRVRVTGLGAEFIDAAIVIGGVISNRKGVNVPSAVLNLSPLTAKDRADLAFGLELGVDWVALSFVQKPGDVIEARGLIGNRAGIMAKIEKPAALEHIDDIVRLSDAVMVARGDLGVEIPHEDVPGRQKELIKSCRLVGKPVIVATQMLDSMVAAPTPTRAEASDVATAIYDGADAVMLSAESATGQYPREAVAMMSRIIESTERHKMYRSIINASQPGEEETAPHAVAAAAADLAAVLHASAIVAFTSSGTTAARIARKRPKVAILAITPDQQVSRQLCLLWGAHSVLSEDIHTYEEMVDRATETALAEAFARPADSIVVVAGIPFGEAGTTPITCGWCRLVEPHTDHRMSGTGHFSNVAIRMHDVRSLEGRADVTLTSDTVRLRPFAVVGRLLLAAPWHDDIVHEGAVIVEVHAAQKPGEQALCVFHRLDNQRAIPRRQRQALRPARGDIDHCQRLDERDRH
jgi:pyruvate kinase